MFHTCCHFIVDAILVQTFLVRFRQPEDQRQNGITDNTLFGFIAARYAAEHGFQKLQQRDNRERVLEAFVFDDAPEDGGMRDQMRTERMP